MLLLSSSLNDFIKVPCIFHHLATQQKIYRHFDVVLNQIRRKLGKVNNTGFKICIWDSQFKLLVFIATKKTSQPTSGIGLCSFRLNLLLYIAM